jgi:hypothetical protein
MALERKDRVAAISAAPPSMPSATRLCLRAAPPGGRGLLDGGWWPRSRDPATELRQLIAGINTQFSQFGTIARVALNLSIGAWDRALYRVAIGDRIVPVNWLRALEAHTIVLTTARGGRITLLVVPQEATAQQGAIALALATLDDSSARPAAIFAASGIIPADSAAASRARHPSVASAPPSTAAAGRRPLPQVARLPRHPR